MQFLEPQTHYNRMTLRLKDPRLYGEFYRFTIDEILFTMPYFMIIYGVFIVQQISSLDSTASTLMLGTLPLLILAVCALRNRCKEYLILGFLLIYIISWVVIWLIKLNQSLDDEDLQDLQFKSTYQFLRLLFVAYCFFSIPSYKWLVTFGSLSIIFCCALITKTIGIDDQSFREHLLKLPASTIAGFMCFHLMQNLRLDKFFRERRLEIQGS